MTYEFSDWLPIDALTNPAITSVFGPVVNAWSKRWFGERPFELKRVSPQLAKSTLKPDKEVWRDFGNGIFINWAVKSQLALASQALHLAKAQHKYSAEDKHLMLSFAECISADLAQAIIGIVGQEVKQPENSAEQFECCGALELEICGVSELACINVGISVGALAGMRKSQCVRYIPDEIQTASILDILGPAKIAVAAKLGHASISVQDFRDLVEGDVIVLDRALSDPLEVCTEHSDLTLFVVTLKQDRDQLFLTANRTEGQMLD